MHRRQPSQLLRLLWILVAFITTQGIEQTVLDAQATEICDNQVDDDGDTLIDCEDPDCQAGIFRDSGQALGNTSSYDVSLGDVDGDGDLDAWAPSFEQADRVWVNQGGDQGGVAGDFADSGQGLGISGSTAVALGDVDGDGDLDAWVAKWINLAGVGANLVFINQGGDQGGVAGNFADSGQTLGNSYSSDVSLGDVDGDGDLDAWVANWDSQANHVWINQGGDQGGVAGNFADSGQALGNSYSSDVSLGDVDGDGDLDAWVANWDSQANHVWINQGGDQGGVAGNFADSGQALGTFWSIGVALGDLDDDGDLDAWVANVAFGGISGHGRVWVNQGGDQGGVAGNFQNSGQQLGITYSSGVSLGDLDDDGDLDAWVASLDSTPHRIWVNQGGDCQETPFIRGDVNGDSGIDISDPITTLGYLFTGGSITCEKAADSNDDGGVNIADAIQLLSHLFSGTAAPPAPFPSCDPDPTDDALDCVSYDGC